MRVSDTTATARASPAGSRVCFTRARYERSPGQGVTRRCHCRVESLALAGWHEGVIWPACPGPAAAAAGLVPACFRKGRGIGNSGRSSTAGSMPVCGPHAGRAGGAWKADSLPPRSRGRLSASRYTDQHPAAKLAIA